MVGTRWLRRIGPGLAALSAVAAIATTSLAARDRSWDPPPCVGAGTAEARMGTWWRLDPRLEAGSLTGQRLTLGGPGTGRARWMDLPAESFAAGPFDGRVLVGRDDGRRSVLLLVAPGRGCVTFTSTSGDVIRRATMTPDRSALIEHRVDRRTRQDLGIFRRPLDGRGAVIRLLAPLTADVRFGPTFTTEFVWSLDGRQLAVQSCGAIACRTRVLDLASGAVRLVADPSHGDLIGLADGRLVLHEACGGLPCAVIAVGVDGGESVSLDHAAWQAALLRDPTGRARVVLETGPDGRDLHAMDLRGGHVQDVPGDAAGRRLVAGPARTDGAVEVGAAQLVLGPGGRVPVEGPAGSVIRRLVDDTAIEPREFAR